MDDIILSNSDIEEVLEDVFVTETVYTEEGKLQLSFEHIQQEITNLLAKDVFKTGKTDLYSALFQAHTTEVPPISTVMPIVKANKYMLEDKFKPVFPYVIDLELDPDNFIKGQLFTDFVEVYSKLSKDREGSYLHAIKSIYRHFQPYDFGTAGKKCLVPQDAVWHHKIEIFRTIPEIQRDIGFRPDVIDADYLKEFKCPQGRKYIERSQIETIYEGDKLDIVGYMNLVDQSKTENMPVWNVQEYKNMLKTLEQKDKVSVFFNTVAYDYRKHPVDSINGHVLENDGNIVVIELEKNVYLENHMLKQLECPINAYVPFFVYNAKFEPKFYKKQLSTHNYRFDFTNTKYVYPQSWSEYVWINCDKYDTYDRLLKHVSYQNTDVELLPMIRHKLARLDLPKASEFHAYLSHPAYKSKSKIFDFSTHKNFLQHYKVPYGLEKTYIDNDISRLLYLNNKPDAGLLYLLQHAEAQWKNIDKDWLNEELKARRQDLLNIGKLNVWTKPQLAKRYDSIKDLEKDNGKEIFVDKKYDKTRYDLKKKTDAHLTGAELKIYLLERVKDDFEVNCIINDKRPVREGDTAVVRFAGSHDITYKWTKIDKKHMWIKTTSVAVCEKTLPSYDNLVAKPSTMVLDTFDNLCKNISDFKKSHRQIQLLSSISAIEKCLLEKPNNEALKDRLAFINSVQEELKEMRKKVNAMFGYIDKIAYDEYVGGENLLNVENMFMNFAYDGGPTIMNWPGKEFAKDEKRTILDILCKVLEIETLEEEDKTYINEYVELKYPEDVPYKAIEAKKDALNKQVDHLLKENRKKSPSAFKDMKLKLETKKAEKIEQERVKILTSHNFDKINLCASMLVLFIMIKYPNIVIRKLVPGCVKFFSYSAYPILKNEEQTRSLAKYMACILKSLYQPKDLRFGMFNEMNDNVKALNISIRQILIDKYDMRAVLEKKEIKEEEIEEEGAYNILNTFFKPNFNFAQQHYKNEVIEYMKSIHETIKASKILRYNIVNMPLVSNTCCVELLVKTSNFYDYFRNEEFKAAQQKANRYYVSSGETISWKPKYRPFEHEELFFEKKIEISKERTAEIKIPLVEIKKKDTKDEDWWNEVLHPNTKEMFAFIANMLIKNDKIDYIKSIVINIEDISDVFNLRNIFANFIKGTFRSMISRWANLYKFKKHEKFDKTDPFVVILESLYEFEGMKPVLTDIAGELKELISKIVYDSNSQEFASAVHNCMSFANDLCKFMLKALWASTKLALPSEDIIIDKLSTALNTTKTPYTKKVAEIFQVLLETFADYIKTNIFNITDLRKEVEILREKRKQEIMAAYSVDDEQRNLQKILKNMGLNIMNVKPEVADVVDVEYAPAEPEVPVVAVVEPEYGDYVDVKGEDEEGDIEYDGYD